MTISLQNLYYHTQAYQVTENKITIVFIGLVQLGTQAPPLCKRPLHYFDSTVQNEYLISHLPQRVVCWPHHVLSFGTLVSYNWV